MRGKRKKRGASDCQKGGSRDRGSKRHRHLWPERWAAELQGPGAMLGSQGAPLSSLGKVCNLGNPPWPPPPASCLPSLFFLSCPTSGSFFSISFAGVSFSLFSSFSVSSSSPQKLPPTPSGFLFLPSSFSPPSLSFSLFSPFPLSPSLPLVFPVAPSFLHK